LDELLGLDEGDVIRVVVTQEDTDVRIGFRGCREADLACLQLRDLRVKSVGIDAVVAGRAHRPNIAVDVVNVDVIAVHVHHEIDIEWRPVLLHARAPAKLMPIASAADMTRAPSAVS